MELCEIAKILKEREILTPAEYSASIGIKLSSKHQELKHQWNCVTVASILDRQEYIGDTINFKSTTRSYKDKTRVSLPQKKIEKYSKIHMSQLLMNILGTL